MLRARTGPASRTTRLLLSVTRWAPAAPGRPSLVRAAADQSISTRKAYTALQLDAPTADLVDLAKSDGPFHSLPTALDRPLLFIVGGVPVRRDGRLVAALGIGGGAPEQDHAFATAAPDELAR
ncbi:heme-binding protein [Kitasatospora sp. NPDC057542]|uniref:GlcG/HbpS family heme-binding protein n=1 Tax=Kitasatospora sp. NPDC057542 TaxID=3346162 RepID=UPI0036AA9D0E